MRRRRPHSFPRGLERLETRALLANLVATRLQIVDGEGESIAPPVVGEFLRMRVEWTSTDLSPANLYRARVALDGIEQEATFRGVSGVGLTLSTTFEGWYAGTGSRTVSFSVDAGNGVTETSESDNQVALTFTSLAPSGLPGKLVAPIGGAQGTDWSIARYPDHSPDEAASDHSGGPFSADRVVDTQYFLANAAKMDAGVPVYAAAAGTVWQVEGDQLDRPLAADSGGGNGNNRVVIAHGNGWLTTYDQLMRRSITVREGDTVLPGQMIAMVGSSGGTEDAKLGFSVLHSHRSNLGDSVAGLVPVDPWVAPASYWNVAAPYQGSAAPGVLDEGITNSPDMDADFAERPLEAVKVVASAGGTITHWVRLSHLRLGDRLDFQWVRPNGSVEGGYSTTIVAGPSDLVWPRFARSLDASVWSAFPGVWRGQVKLNGTVIASSPVEVVNSGSVARLRVASSGTFERDRVLNSRTTPLALGATTFGHLGPVQSITLENPGNGPLVLGLPRFPRGVAIVGGFPSTIAAGSSASFALRLDGTQLGESFGEVRFATNAVGVPLFRFNVAGTASGAPPQGAPSAVFATQAAFAQTQVTRRLDTRAAVGDPDAIGFAGAVLSVDLVAGALEGDRLSIASQGTGPGQIATGGSAVYYEGQLIGTYDDTRKSYLTVAFGGFSTATSAMAVARAITFASAAVGGSMAPRYVRWQLTDQEGNRSLPDYLTIGFDDTLAAAVQTTPAQAETNEAGANALISVMLTRAPSSPMAVLVSTSDASEGVPEAALLTFTPANWSHAQFVSVVGRDDAQVDGPVGYRLWFDVRTDDPMYRAVVPSEVMLTNYDDDATGGGGGGGGSGGGGGEPEPDEFRFVESQTIVDESAGHVTAHLTRTGNLTEAATVRVYTRAGSAQGGEDFVTYSAIVRFGPNESSKSVTVPIVDDSRLEQQERFDLVLSQPSPGWRVSPQTMAILIRDNEITPPAQPPKVARVTLILNRSARARALSDVRVAYSQAMRPDLAASASAFRLTTAGVDGRFGTKDDIVLRLKSVRYDKATKSSLLSFGRPLKLPSIVRLLIRGSKLLSTHGLALDGNRDGKAGGDDLRLLRAK